MSGFWAHVDSANFGRPRCDNWPERRRQDVECLAAMGDGRRCERPPAEDGPLCEFHEEKAALHLIDKYSRHALTWANRKVADLARASIAADRSIDAALEARGLKSKVYFLTAADEIVKIGRSVNVEARVAQIRQGSSLMPDGYDRKSIELAGTTPGGPSVERTLHRVLAPHRIKGEWFHMHRDVVAVMAYLCAGEMKQEANRVFVEARTRPWWVDEGYETESDAIRDLEASA